MNKKYLYLIIPIAIILIGGFFITWKLVKGKKIETTTSTITSATTTEKTKTTEPEKAIIPLSYSISGVPFTPQAPFAVWDETHNEACEEAAVYMVHQYLSGDRRSKIPPDEADKEILEMVRWQQKNWGGHKDLTAQEISDLAKGFYGYKNIKIKYDFTVDDVKEAISQNRPVIIPTAGRLLGNPNYKTPGPVYHALVIKGYDENKVITNDPGTRNGQNYTYSWKTLLNSAHEWDGTPDNIQNGREAMIIISD